VHESLHAAIEGKVMRFHGEFRRGKIQHTERGGAGAAACRRRGQQKNWAAPPQPPAMWSFSTLAEVTFIADTPGFSSFDMEQMEPVRKERLQDVFPEFAPFLGSCRFQDCAHIHEPGCAVLAAVSEGKIHPSRHASYVRLYDLAARRKDWEMYCLTTRCGRGMSLCAGAVLCAGKSATEARWAAWPWRLASSSCWL
jgi:hypothetical protein